MKKSLLIGVVLFSVALVSCKKDYSCECTNTSTQNGGNTTITTENFEIKEANKTQAQAACLEANIVQIGSWGKYERKCELSK